MSTQRSSSMLPSALQVRATIIERFLDRFTVRAILSAAIMISLVPMPWVDAFDPVFFAVFGAEFVGRMFSVAVLPRRTPDTLEIEGAIGETLASDERPRTRWGAWVLLSIDFIALMSFLPISGGVLGARWLRVFRLTRMLLLVGYWAPLMRDLWSILARRERARQLILMGFVVGGLSFAGAVLLYYLSDAPVDVDGDGLITAGDHSFLALLWWSFRQVQDPGNMLASPMALPVVVISMMLTVFGLFLVSFLIGMGTDVVHELLDLSRLRPPGLRQHTVVVNITPPTRRLLHELIRYYRKLFPSTAPFLSLAWLSEVRRRGLGGPRYLIVGHSEEPPEFLRQPDLSRIVYRQRTDDEEELIRRSDLLRAKRVVLLADENDSAPDAETIRTLVTLVERVRDREQRGELLEPLGRRRVIIAEILDESNVSAAQAALATGAGSFRGFVVPTERLLALFFASVVRRPGLGLLLEELLTSRGHEIYTCFFHTPGLDFTMERTPDLGADARRAMDDLQRRGLAAGQGARVVPLGLLTAIRAKPGGRDFGVLINPSPEETTRRAFRGFIGIADNFRSIWTLAETLHENAPALPPDELPPEAVMPDLARTHRRKTTRVLVCGFRPGSIYMLEELFRSDPRGEILVLVEDEAARERATDALAAHSQLVRKGLMRGRHGVFDIAEGGRVTFGIDPEGGAPRSTMHLEVADWMASRHLVDLPAEFGHVAELDAVVFVASDAESADKRTTTALLKLEQLVVGSGDRRPRVVAEVIDGKLANRLGQRCRALGIDDVHVFSIQELRAYFLFQSVVVPGFDTVYAELLGSWGQSFVHKDVAEAGEGTCTFAALSLHVRRGGEILIGVELRHARSGSELCVAPAPGERGASFDLRDLVGVWVLAPDSSDESLARVALGAAQ